MSEKKELFMCMEYGKNGGAAEFFNLHSKDYNEAKEKLKKICGDNGEIVKRLT
jgi:hypothetical protein